MKNLAMVIIIVSWMFGLTGDELVQKMEDRVTPIDSQVDMVMTLINKKGKTMTVGQLQTLLNKYFEDHDLPTINANELRDLSVQHFSKKGADVRSLQTLRQVKQLRRLQTLKVTDFDRLQNSFRKIHLRNLRDGENKQS